MCTSFPSTQILSFASILKAFSLPPATGLRMSMSTAQGGATLDAAYLGASFDGRYVYFVPRYSDTFIRFDTQGVFTTAGDWAQMNMSTAQGGATLDNAYLGASFDGRYVYFVPFSSNTFVRFEAMFSKGKYP